MTVWEALVLGVVQGATEFLPVSSSGHLVLLQRLFGIGEPGLVFETAVHGGTLVAVVSVLWPEIWKLLRRPFQPLTLYLIIATIPAVIAALLFRSRLEEAFTSAVFLGLAFLITSALLFVSEMLFRKSAARGTRKMTWVDALFIGAFQAVAILPGISRSGATISAGLARKIDRESAARFSFLLSIPAILGGLVLHAKDFFRAAIDPTAAVTILPLAAGTFISAVTGFFAIKLALRIIRERSLLGFSVYTGLLGVVVLVLL